MPGASSTPPEGAECFFASVGDRLIRYALFLAINAAGVWGGVFPFLPLEFQTPEIVFWFFLAQSLVFSFSYFASALGSYFFPGPTRSWRANSRPMRIVRPSPSSR